ncbi:hypothetical protein BIV60_15455 [Bacillus sp. MUM 116]|uniref:hypothetical protein n=1 Tax=Bacillus sp. MUM 116 TaxID=1678002 RepID=UPI0008F5BEFE|nr:hypothetical protein [Bacillus sp. MUM 116]OIK12919.1 hypothetical protein BIV60_15455 [Bacillus sp. MUM 116]
MIEKKEFLIPKNIDEGVKLFGDIKAMELIKTLTPSLLLSAGIFYTPINPFVKLGVAAVLILIPGYLIADRPVRKNINVLYHLKSWIRYELRQKQFSYQKERYHAESVSKIENKGTKTKTNSAKLHSIKSGTWKPINHQG